MAAALQATRCEIIKEVDGVCTADPRLVPESRPLRKLNLSSLGEMCFWGAKVLHFRSVELARSKNVPLSIKMWGQSVEATSITNEVSNMEIGKVLSVNSHPRIEHIGVQATNLNEAFDKFSVLLKAHSLAWPQLLASAQDGAECRMMLTADGESLDALVRAAEATAGFRRTRDSLSSVSLTCFGGVASDLPHRALQILSTQSIAVDKYVLSPHSVTLILKPEQREAAVRALHTLV